MPGPLWLLQAAVEQGRKLTGEDMASIQLDTSSGLWPDLKPVLAALNPVRT
eukprot:SAG22_NODE_947_length_6367_cov_23.437460_2_plen_51_part_00